MSEPPRPSASEPLVALAVVGAHLRGQPLNHQLTDLGAELERSTRTAPSYRLFALETVPQKPGLLRVLQGGQSIEIEVWSLTPAAFGTFVSGVERPLCIGQVELADGRWVHGFLCEAHATQGAPEITRFGSWRGYLEARQGGEQ